MLKLKVDGNKFAECLNYVHPLHVHHFYRANTRTPGDHIRFRAMMKSLAQLLDSELFIGLQQFCNHNDPSMRATVLAGRSDPDSSTADPYQQSFMAGKEVEKFRVCAVVLWRSGAHLQRSW